MWLPKLMLRFMSQALYRCIVTFHLFFLLYQRRSSCWKYWKWCSYFENYYHNEETAEKNTINFLFSPYCTLLFSRKENRAFWSSSGSCPLQLPDQLLCDCVNLGLEILQQIFTYLWKTAIEALNFLWSVLEQLTVVVLKSF